MIIYYRPSVWAVFFIGQTMPSEREGTLHTAHHPCMAECHTDRVLGMADRGNKAQGKGVWQLGCSLFCDPCPYFRDGCQWRLDGEVGEVIADVDNRSAERLNLMVINAVVPMLFAGRYKRNEVCCDRAFDIIEQCRSEKNAITKHWEQFGIKAETAGDSQALIQLQREYCDKRQCLRCRFGYEFLRGRTKIEGYRNLAIELDLFMELY